MKSFNEHLQKTQGNTDRGSCFMENLNKHPQWEAVVFIQKKLTSHGFKVFIAGGGVRDLLLKKQPADLDLATNAKPQEVEKMFEKTVMVGAQFGVSRVIVGGHDIEVATFRKDGPYLDGRKPQSIEFSSEEEDARRRDFTINALFYDFEKDGIIDFVGGRKDLESRIIRAVGEPEERFKEDKLRVLRALRFHAQLGFPIEKKTFKAIKIYAPLIKQVSMERIRDEWEKILISKNFLSCLEKIRESRLWSALFPSWSFCSEDYRKTYPNPPACSPEKAWILWFLIHTSFFKIKSKIFKKTERQNPLPASVQPDCGTVPNANTKLFSEPSDTSDPQTDQIKKEQKKIIEQTRHWKFSNSLRKKITCCHQSLPFLYKVQDQEPVDLAIFLNKEYGELAMEIFQTLFQKKAEPEFLEKTKKARSFLENGRLPPPLVSGEDLLQKGFRPGPEIAQVLKKIYKKQLTERITEKEILMGFL